MRRAPRKVPSSVCKTPILRKPLSFREKAYRLLRTFTTRSSSIEMVVEASDEPFEKVIAPIQAYVSQGKNQISGKPVSPRGRNCVACMNFKVQNLDYGKI